MSHATPERSNLVGFALAAEKCPWLQGAGVLLAVPGRVGHQCSVHGYPPISGSCAQVHQRVYCANRFPPNKQKGLAQTRILNICRTDLKRCIQNLLQLTFISVRYKVSFLDFNGFSTLPGHLFVRCINTANQSRNTAKNMIGIIFALQFRRC